MAEASDIFWGVVLKNQSPKIECTLCGRLHIAKNGEFENKDSLLEEARKNPDKFVIHELDLVPWGTIAGKVAAYNCPCNKVKNFEDFIWGHRFIISNYLKMRTREILEESQIVNQEMEEIKLPDEKD